MFSANKRATRLGDFMLQGRNAVLNIFWVRVKSVCMHSTWSEATNNNIHTTDQKGQRNQQNGKSRVHALHFSESLSLSFCSHYILCVCVTCHIFFSVFFSLHVFIAAILILCRDIARCARFIIILFKIFVQRVVLTNYYLNVALNSWWQLVFFFSIRCFVAFCKCIWKVNEVVLTSPVPM